jgi:hypothetical protein
MRPLPPASLLRISRHLRRVPIWLCVIVVLTACSGSPGFPLGRALPTATAYRAPTAAVPLTPLVAIPPTQAATPKPVDFPTATPACSNNLRYIADLTIPDGTVVSPGETIDKRWQVENSGTCNWDQSYRFRLTAGSDLGASNEQALFPARSGIEFPLRILFSAPQEPGTYRSAWQAIDPQGQSFGDPVFVEVVVQPASAP